MTLADVRRAPAACTVLAFAALCLGGCPFTVVFPPAMQVDSQDFSITADDRIEIRVVFSNPVELSSIVPADPTDSAADLINRNLVLRTDRVEVAQVTVTPGSTPYDILITTVEDYSNLLSFDPDGTFTLILDPVDIEQDGCELQDVFDTNGQCLDYYETRFVFIG